MAYNLSGNTIPTQMFPDDYPRNLMIAERKEIKSAMSADAVESIAHGTEFDILRCVFDFTYTETAVFGVWVGRTCAVIDTASKTIGYSNAYSIASTTQPTIETSKPITFDFVVGNQYSVEIFKNAADVTVTIRDCKFGTEATMSVNKMQQCVGKCGVTVFSGTIDAGCINYYTPLFCHAKCLILGDSIVEGLFLANNSNADKRWSYKLFEDYFNGSCVISGVGSCTAQDGYDRFLEMTAMGYSFDYVICALGTNGNPASGNDVDKAYYARRIASIISDIEATGSKVIWGLPAMATGTYADPIKWSREAILSIEGIDIIRFDYATMDENGDKDAELFADGVHPNVDGHQRMYEYAVNKLHELGV